MNLTKKPTSIYIFNNIDAINTFFNEKESDQEVSFDWANGFLPYKLGKGDFNLEAAIKRIKAEYSAMVIYRPQVILQLQMPFDTIEKIDDEIRSLLVKKFPNEVKYISFSDKANGTGEYVLMNIKPILKKMNKLNFLKRHLTNKEIKSLLLSEKFKALAKEQFQDMIQEILVTEYNCENLLFTPYKKQEFLIDNILTSYDNNIKYINIWAATRAAKTAAVISAVIQRGLIPIFIGKSKTSMASAIHDYLVWFSSLTKMIVFSVNGAETNFSPEKLLKALQDLDIDPTKVVFIIDEADDKSHSPKSIKAYKQSRKLIAKYGWEVDMVIAMSATRPYQADKILTALKSKNDKIKTLEMSYEMCRSIDPINTPKRNMVVQAFNMTNLHYPFQSLLDDNNVGGSTILADLIIKYGFGDINIQNSNKIIKHNKLQPDYFIRLVANTTNKVNNFISSLESSLAHLPEDYLVVEVTGKNTTKYHIGAKTFKMNNGNAEKIIDQIKLNNPNKIIVMVTMGMATTSFSEKSIGRTIVLSPDGVTADIYQGAHRSTTPDSDLKEEAQMILFTTADCRFKDLLAHETNNLTSGEKEKYYNQFLNNGSSCVYNLINNSQGFPMDLSDSHHFVKILDEQSKFLATSINFETILRESETNIGSGIKSTTEKTKGKKPTKVDGYGNLVSPSHTDTKNTKNIDYKAMATATMILPILAKYYISDCNSVDKLDEYNELWKQVGLNASAFTNLLQTNALWKESFEVRWSIVNNWNKQEALEGIMYAMNTEVFRKLNLTTIPDTNLPFTSLLNNKSITESVKDGFLKKDQNILLYFSQIYYKGLISIMSELSSNGINVTVVVPSNKLYVFTNYILPATKNCIIDVITEDSIFKYTPKKGETRKMKYDYIVSNPPYQGTNSNTPLWQVITYKCHTYLLKDTGLLSIVHPGNWKTATNYLINHNKETTIVRDMIINYKTKSLTLHDTTSGNKTFGASTIYDCYVISKEKSDDNSKLEIKTQQGVFETINLDEMQSIPVGRVKEFQKLSTSIISDRIDVNTSNIKASLRVGTKDSKHVVPVVTKLKQDTPTQKFEDNLEYTAVLPTEQKTPKLIISRGGTYSFVDDTGEYGVAVDGFFIKDTPERLFKMQKVLDESQEFRLLLSEISGSNDKRTLDPKRCSRSYIFEFSKTFWEDFYTDDMNKELIQVGKINE